MAGFDPVIPAGGSGKLTAKVKTHGTQKGRMTKIVTVTTDDPVAKTIQLKMSFEVEPAIEVKPTGRPTIQVLEGESGSMEIVLHRVDGKPLEVTKIETGGAKLITVKKWPAKKADQRIGAHGGDVVLEITTGPLSGFTTRSQLLTVYTNHPKVPEMRIPVMLRVRPLIETVPSMVRLWIDPKAKETDAGVTSVVIVRSNDKKPFTIKAVEVEDPSIVSVELKNKGAATQHSIAVRVDPKLVESIGKATKRTMLTIRTDSETKPVLKVSVLVAMRRQPIRVPVNPSIKMRGGQSQAMPNHLRINPKNEKLLKPVPNAEETPLPVPPPEQKEQ